MDNLAKLVTESRNPNSMQIDAVSTHEILSIINQEDMSVATSVQKAIPQIAEAVEAVYASLTTGGRLFYIGAGTSGRIGIMDAVECPPTFGVSPETVQAIMAGGMNAFVKAVEGAEDNEAMGASDLRERNLTAQDVVLGIAASGRTPYVMGGLKYANEIGATTISLASNENSPISQCADIKIETITGPEVLTGSTRMKAATAHKMVLNMITTAVMIKLGKVYENLMVDLKATNYKLRERAINIVATVTGASREEVQAVLETTDYQVKPAIVMIEAGVDLATAERAIEQACGYVRKAIQMLEQAN